MSRRKRRSSPTSAGARSVPRKLLVPTALSVGAMLWGCKQHVEPLPGNPKGSHYDEGSYGGTAPTAAPTSTNETPPDTTDPETKDPGTKDPATKDPGMKDPNTKVPEANPNDGGAPPLPANPKGSWYDDGGYPGEEA